MWYIEQTETLVVITEIPKIPIHTTRNIWIVIGECRKNTSLSRLNIELVSRHVLPNNSLPRPTANDIVITTITWFAVLMRPTDHHLVPEHRKITKAECHWPATRLPRILQTDPMVVYLGLRSGDIVQIKRAADDDFRAHLYYRVVC